METGWKLPGWSRSNTVQHAESPQLDVGELQVAHDLQLVDAAQVLRAVPEVKQVRPVDGHLELVRLTEDENLEQKNNKKKSIH